MRAAEAEGNRVHFLCPGCDKPHGIYHSNDKGWIWNGDLERPTFHPSVLIKRTMGNWKHADDPDYEEHDEVCHSFVTDGKIDFLPDSTHDLSGQTVDLPPWPYSQAEL